MGKKRYNRMLPDDMAWERSDKAFENWAKTIYKREIYQPIADLITKHRGGEPLELHRPIRGSYNVVFRLDFKDGSALMRIPCPGIVRFPEEKLRVEVATMRYIAEKTTLPVPHIYHYGTADENPSGLGPFIILDYIKHDRTMADVLKDPSLNRNESKVLDPTIPEEKLEFAYGQMASILLQLSALDFPRIGSLLLEHKDECLWSVAGRPLIQNMNSLIEHAAVPTAILPSPTQSYSTTDEWYMALADMHMAQLTFQHNDAIDSEDDAREKYVARQLFRRLAAEKRLASGFTSPTNSSRSPESALKLWCEDLRPSNVLVDTSTSSCGSPAGAFKLWCEDLRPSNVLVDSEMRIVGVIDWEFAYVAPAQFTFDPPWWLLLEDPEFWSGGHTDWMQHYERRLDTFLRALEAEERKKERINIAMQIEGQSPADDGTEIPLSVHMRESWETQTFWLSYAARKSWAFDTIFWKFLDEKFFGYNKTSGYESRLNLLTDEERKAMGLFVERKVEESKKRILVDWDPEEAKDRLAEVLL